MKVSIRVPDELRPLLEVCFDYGERERLLALAVEDLAILILADPYTKVRLRQYRLGLTDVPRKKDDYTIGLERKAKRLVEEGEQK